MRFKQHSHLAGQHAFLSASNGAWVNYEEDKLDRVYLASLAARRGTEKHAFAAEAIRLGVKLRGNDTLASYVNDCIGYRMVPEQVLYYSENCFGTADAISFRRNKLRISDLKTGVTPVNERQLEIYAAIFCLEYLFKPQDIPIELRIYQNDEVKIYDADPVDISLIMERIVAFDKRIRDIREEADL